MVAGGQIMLGGVGGVRVPSECMCVVGGGAISSKQLCRSWKFDFTVW